MPKATGSKNVILSPPVWNRVDEAVEHWHQQERLGEGTPSVPAPLSTDCIKLQNNSGSDLARGAVLQVQDDLLTGESELLAASLWFAGIAATADNKPFGVIRQAMKSGKIDSVQVSGVVIARVNVTNADHERAYLKSGETNLQSSDDGSVLILWKPSGTGVKECVVLLHNPKTGREIIRFGLASDLTLGGEAYAYQYKWDGSYYAWVGDYFTVKDYTGNSWSGATTFRGWAFKPADNDGEKYEIVWMETIARRIRFTANEDWGATTVKKIEVTVDAWWDGRQPPATVIVHDEQEAFESALLGSEGSATWNDREARYDIDDADTKAGWVKTTLATGVASQESDAAERDDWGGTQRDRMDPGGVEGEVDLKDKYDFCKRALAGSNSFSIRDELLDQYLMLIAETMAGVVEFTLAGPFTGSPPSASGTIGLYYGSQLDYQQPAGGGSSVTIIDEQNMFPRSATGSKGKAHFDWVANKYRAFYCEQVGITAKATLSSNLTGGGTASITGFTITSPTPFNLSPTSTPTSAANPQKHRGLSGATVWLAWDGSSAGEWVVVDIERVTAQFPLLFSGTGPLRLNANKLQGYMVDVAIELGATPTWVDLLEYTEECEEE